jgi:alkanesulfonate monooxygenase SsuD/methylene tetrahydromethanopterin reductase-like flavin-dependent oxidoreductase (luciferase family)
MNLGYFTMPLHPLGSDYRKNLEQDRQAAVLADQLGFSEAFFGEHVSDATEQITSCLMFIAYLASQTSQIKLGSGVLNLPNGHPAAFAAQVAMIDTLLNGRFIMGIGPGGLASDWEVFETLDKDRQSMFVECIDHILAIWERDAPYDISGEHWNISTKRTNVSGSGVGTMPKPLQRPHPEIVSTVLSPDSKGLAIAAARDWHPMSSNYLQTQSLRNHWNNYNVACRANGAATNPKNWRVVRNIFVANDEESAVNYAKSADGPYAHNIQQIYEKLSRSGRLAVFKESPDQPESDLTLPYLIDRLVIAGTPTQVCDQIVALREKTGPFGTIVYAGVDWADDKLARCSMELMAKSVMPMVNKAVNEGA